MSDIIEAVAHEPSTDLAVAAPSIVRPAASLAEIQEASTAYQELYRQLLDPSDFQGIGAKRFVKKSGWRKLALAFNVSFSFVSKEYERNEAGRIIRAEIIARATAPNGRFAESLGACDAFDKCTQYCNPNCNGFRHFSKPSHDLPATAETRAKNRAASDLFGMGEVSAEEVSADQEPPRFDGLALLDPYLQKLTLDQKMALKEWRTGANMPPPSQMDAQQTAAALVEIGHIMALVEQETPVDPVEAVLQADEREPYPYDEPAF